MNVVPVLLILGFELISQIYTTRPAKRDYYVYSGSGCNSCQLVGLLFKLLLRASGLRVRLGYY